MVQIKLLPTVMAAGSTFGCLTSNPALDDVPGKETEDDPSVGSLPDHLGDPKGLLVLVWPSLASATICGINPQMEDFVLFVSFYNYHSNNQTNK